MAARAVTEVGSAVPGLARALNGNVLVVFPRFSDLAARIAMEPEVVDERGWVTAAFAPVGITPSTAIVGIEPRPEEIADAAERAAAADATVLFLYDAHLFPSNRALLEALQARARCLAVVLLRDPYDAALLLPGWGARGRPASGGGPCQMEAVAPPLTPPGALVPLSASSSTSRSARSST